MKHILSMGIMAFVFVFFVGCKKTETKEMDPQLKIIVKDASANTINGANVNLFITVNDFQQGINAVDSSSTGADGSVLFTGLDEIKYYFTVECQGKSNRFGVAATTDPLEPGYIVVVETIIE